MGGFERFLIVSVHSICFFFVVVSSFSDSFLFNYLIFLVFLLVSTLPRVCSSSSDLDISFIFPLVPFPRFVGVQKA